MTEQQSGQRQPILPPQWGKGGFELICPDCKRKDAEIERLRRSLEILEQKHD